MKQAMCMRVIWVLIVNLFIASSVQALPHSEKVEADIGSKQLKDEPYEKRQWMTNARLGEIISRIDSNAKGESGFWSFTVEGVSVQVITDERANRMRIIVPIAKTQDLSQDELYRLMQANFDSTLDARYAIANEILWSAYIHPLEQLNDEGFLVGLGQAVNVALTYGTTYSSGLLNFEGGDSKGILKKNIIEELKRKGQVI